MSASTPVRTPAQEAQFKEIKEMARTAHWRALDDVAKLVTRLWADNRLLEADAEYAFAIIGERRAWDKTGGPPPSPAAIVKRAPESYVGSRPRTARSLPDRREQSRENWLSPADGRELTNGEAAVLSIVAEEIMKFGACRLFVDKIAALAGVSRRWAQHALRKLARLAMISCEHRPRDRRRHDTNVVVIHESRPELTACIKRRKTWWRGRGPLKEIGRTLVRATRLKSLNSIPHTRDSSVSTPPLGAGRAAGGASARTGPAGPPRLAPG